jgi:hypothetical protein
VAAGVGGQVTGREPSSGSDGTAATGNGVPVADGKSTGEPAPGIGAVLAGGALSATYGGPVGADLTSGAVVADGLPAGRNSSGDAMIDNGAPALGRQGREAVEGPAGADPQSSGDNGAPVAGWEGQAAVEGPAGARSSGANGASVDPGPDEAAAPSGRHAATDRTPFRPPTSTHNPGSEGRRHRPDPEELPDTEGLGLADLLAGALAAYRGI